MTLAVHPPVGDVGGGALVRVVGRELVSLEPGGLLCHFGGDEPSAARTLSSTLAACETTAHREGAVALELSASGPVSGFNSAVFEFARTPFPSALVPSSGPTEGGARSPPPRRAPTTGPRAPPPAAPPRSSARCGRSRSASRARGRWSSSPRRASRARRPSRSARTRPRRSRRLGAPLRHARRGRRRRQRRRPRLPATARSGGDVRKTGEYDTTTSRTPAASGSRLACGARARVGRVRRDAARRRAAARLMVGGDAAQGDVRRVRHRALRGAAARLPPGGRR